jgi:Tfp pilus assembly protein PilF
MAHSRVIAAAMVMVAASAAPAATQTASHQHLGAVHFETSCNETAQRHFDEGMRYQHSFWYRESKARFEEALRADAQCAIAYWGIAQSLLANPFNATPRQNLVQGLAAIQKARQIGARTPRENELIAAIETFYAGFDERDQRTRAQAYATAMEGVARRFPADDEAQIYYALALLMSASPADKTYANQLASAAILEPIVKRRPDHPGVAHYLIHSYDYPALAAKGLDAAARYARIAEAAPHAQHMPSHIFTRAGYWKESIASNSTAAKLAKAGKEPDDQLHAADYLVYAYLQLGLDREARRTIDEMRAVTGYNPDRNTGPFALAASPARYAVERGDWTAAAQLEPRPSRFAYADAMTHFARALGAARSGKPDAATADIDKLAALRDRLRAAKDAYWADQVDIQWQAASAWLLHARGNHEGALTAMRAAVDAEDKTEKATVTPGPLAPAREMYGELLLERSMAREALAAYEQTMAREPNRYRSIAGAAKAAEALGDTEKARTYYTKLLALTSESNSDRPEVAAAKQFLAKK